MITITITGWGFVWLAVAVCIGVYLGGFAQGFVKEWFKLRK